MRNIKLLDGTIFEVDRCGAADGRLRIRIIDPVLSMLEAVQIFGDPEMTASIEHFVTGSDVDRVTFEGYTSLEAMIYDGPGLLIILREEVSND